MSSSSSEALSQAAKTNPGNLPQLENLRIDKWLWTARFFKTRTAAADAVGGGHVHVDGERVKPARKLKRGDRLRIRRGQVEWDIVVEGIIERRGPASVAQTLYTETETSLVRRQEAAEQRKLTAQNGYRSVGKPTRRERQDLEKLKGRSD